MTYRKLFLKVTQFCFIALLIVGTRQVLADCRSDVSSGWRIDSKCTTRFDAEGNYVESYCGMDANGDPYGRYHMTCKPGMDSGTCIGSTCEQGPLCTWDGYCRSDFDCCGINVCHQESRRCREPGSEELEQ